MVKATGRDTGQPGPGLSPNADSLCDLEPGPSFLSMLIIPIPLSASFPDSLVGPCVRNHLPRGICTADGNTRGP